MKIEQMLHIAADSQKFGPWTDTLGYLVQSDNKLQGRKLSEEDLLDVAGGVVLSSQRATVGRQSKEGNQNIKR